MKKTLILATGVIVAMASCTKETFVGQSQGSTQTPIVFGSTNSAVTKSVTSKEHADKLGNRFVVYGWKETGGTKSVVFDHYNVKFVPGTEHSTASNLKGWEYVGIDTVNADNETEVIDTNWKPVTKQTIKFWDKNADKYKFIAFSRGKGANNNFASFSTIDTSKIGKTDPVYIVSGKDDALAAIYIADMDSVSNINNYLTTPPAGPITPKFKSVAAKIRVAFYETIPGYSVKSLQFYDESDAPSADNKVLLYVPNDAEGSLPSGKGKLNVYIDNNGSASAKFELESSAEPSANTLQFDNSIILNNVKEDAEQDNNIYMGRTSNTASYSHANPDSAYKFQLPIKGVALAVKVRYTLVSTDGSGEEIEAIDPVVAIIPAEYTNWQSNYAYTYIFKISDKSGNLEPITFDAVVIDSQEGVQETVTSMGNSDLTTYAKDFNPTKNNEYLVNSNIYVSHKNPSENNLNSDNTNLYTVEIESGACQGITEGSFANAMALISTTGYRAIVKASTATQKTTTVGDPVDDCYTISDDEYTPCASGELAVDGKTYYNVDPANVTAWIIKDANGEKMTITKANSLLTTVDEIAASDAPDGKTAISGNFAKFTPTSAGIYAFEYVSSTVYKIIKVASTEK